MITFQLLREWGIDLRRFAATEIIPIHDRLRIVTEVLARQGSARKFALEIADRVSSLAGRPDDQTCHAALTRELRNIVYEGYSAEGDRIEIGEWALEFEQWKHRLSRGRTAARMALQTDGAYAMWDVAMFAWKTLEMAALWNESGPEPAAAEAAWHAAESAAVAIAREISGRGIVGGSANAPLEIGRAADDVAFDEVFALAVDRLLPAP